MNRKCKKIGIFIGLTMAIAGMTACGETEPEETPVVKEETAKPTETPAPTATSTPAPTPTPSPTPTPIPEYVDYDYEEAGVTIQIPGILWNLKQRKLMQVLFLQTLMNNGLFDSIRFPMTGKCGYTTI
ncbi:MAG: hypothetical protein ACLTBK_09355 [Blautia wexlerae]